MHGHLNVKLIKISAYCPHSACMCSVWFKRNSHFFYLEQLLNMFTTSRKAAISFVMSVRPHGITRLPLDEFNGMWYLRIFLISVEKTEVSLKSDNNNRYFSEDLHTFMILLRMRNVLDKSFRENQNKIQFQYFFPPKILPYVRQQMQCCVTTSTVVRRTRHNVMLYVKWLSCYWMVFLRDVTWKEVLNFYVLPNDVQA